MNESNEKSLVEQFYDALASKMGVSIPWTHLNSMEQHEFITGINCIIGVMHGLKQSQGK